MAMFIMCINVIPLKCLTQIITSCSIKWVHTKLTGFDCIPSIEKQFDEVASYVNVPYAYWHNLLYNPVNNQVCVIV